MKSPATSADPRPSVTTREQALALDAADELARYRDRFVLAEGVIYLDGNSLGPLLQAAVDRVDEVVRHEWGRDLIRSWTANDWIDLPRKVAGEIAPLIGAAADEVAVADSTSVNLFKLLAAALRLRPSRQVILAECESFPTDLYMAQGLVDLLGERAQLRLVPRSELQARLDQDVAVLMLTHVDFRSGEMYDIEASTAAAHRAGALMLWDLAHSAGAVPVDLGAARADLAVGCGYKYLNGGPGAPAFAYVAARHLERLEQPLWGWMGHAAPFEMDTAYRPVAGIDRLRVGTPPILSLAALEVGVMLMAEIGIELLRRKSVALTGLLVELVETRCRDHGFELASPRDPGRRGSQVAFRHPEGYAVMQALIAAGVIGDFRAPDLLRFGLAPAYVRFVDVWDAVEILDEIMRTRSWDRPEYRIKAKVT